MDIDELKKLFLNKFLHERWNKKDNIYIVLDVMIESYQTRSFCIKVFSITRNEFDKLKIFNEDLNSIIENKNISYGNYKLEII